MFAAPETISVVAVATLRKVRLRVPAEVTVCQENFRTGAACCARGDGWIGRMPKLQHIQTTITLL